MGTKLDNMFLVQCKKLGVNSEGIRFLFSSELTLALEVLEFLEKLPHRRSEVKVFFPAEWFQSDVDFISIRLHSGLEF